MGADTGSFLESATSVIVDNLQDLVVARTEANNQPFDPNSRCLA